MRISGGLGRAAQRERALLMYTMSAGGTIKATSSWPFVVAHDLRVFGRRHLQKACPRQGPICIDLLFGGPANAGDAYLQVRTWSLKSGRLGGAPPEETQVRRSNKFLMNTPTHDSSFREQAQTHSSLQQKIPISKKTVRY